MTVAFQQGKEVAFDFFFREFFPSLCFFANRILDNLSEAEEIASFAFIKIWEKHPQFNHAQSIRSYLYKIVKNDCLKFIAKRAKRLEMQNEILYLNHSYTDKDQEADLITTELLRNIYNEFKHLPPACYKVFKMLYIEGKTVKAIAKELNVSESTIKTQKARGLETLRKKYIPFQLFFIILTLKYVVPIVNKV